MNSTRRRSFQVGDRVTVTLGRRKVNGTIIQDRGPIGVGRRRLFQVEIPLDPDEPMRLETAEDELEVPNGKEIRALDKDKVIEYLKNGGLMSILRSNPGGKNPSPVWLAADTFGNVTHSFVESRGLVGGESPPSFAFYEDRVFAPRADLVVAFLEHFGLSPREARDVVSSVGTAP